MAALLLALVARSHAGQAWYVSTTGSDANAGTSNAPLQHVQTAMNQARYGDTVNIQAGIYREQVLLPWSWTNNAGPGSPSNMVTVQAWDTNGDGIIESNEMPTLNAFQLLTNWTALGNTQTWAALTGGTPYQSNTIFWTSWCTNASTNVPFNMVAESETNVLLPTSWPNYYACDHPYNMPTNMTLGSFQYNYNTHILYVWRSDGNVPGPAWPIQAAVLDTNLWAGGGQGPFGIYPSYFHVKGLRFRYCNGVNNPNAYDGGAMGVGLGAYSILENCDSEWVPYQGGESFASVVTNCTFSNNGELALSICGTNELVTGCTFVNNGFMRYSGGCMNEGTLHVQINDQLGGPSLAGMLISNNTFLNNWGDAIHIDTAWGTPSNLCVIANNFIYGTNIGHACNGCLNDYALGIDLELGSYVGIYNNILVVDGGSIMVNGGSGNQIINNTVFPGAFVFPDPDRVGGPFLSVNNLVANNIFFVSGYNPSLAACIDSTNLTATIYGPVCYSNIYANNLCWNSSPGILTRLNLLPPPYSPTTTAIPITNIDVLAHMASGTDSPFQNTGNLVANPLFFNPANTTNPGLASYYLLSSNSPARNAGSGAYGLTSDFAGNPRGLYPDVGAYQFGLYYADTFARTALAPWVAESGTWSLGNGSLQGLGGSGSYASVCLSNVWSNYVVVANLQFSSSNAYGGGLAACLNPGTGARYAAWLYPEGSPVAGGQPLLKLLKFQNWTSSSYLGISGQAIAQANLPAVGTNAHTVELALQGPQITVYVDGTQTLSATDAESAPYLSGGIGVDLYTAPSQPYSLSISNVQIEAYLSRPLISGGGAPVATPTGLRSTP
jgi:hypothetical protein